MVSIVGRLQVRSWDKDGERRWTTEVVIEEQYFAESKKDSGEGKAAAKESGQAADGFYPIDEDIEDDGDLPF
mgnify:CR=1 FL=1